MPLFVFSQDASSPLAWGKAAKSRTCNNSLSHAKSVHRCVFLVMLKSVTDSTCVCVPALQLLGEFFFCMICSLQTLLLYPCIHACTHISFLFKSLSTRKHQGCHHSGCQGVWTHDALAAPLGQATRESKYFTNIWFYGKKQLEIFSWNAWYKREHFPNSSTVVFFSS